MAPLKFLPMEVHFNPDSLANILSINNISSIPVVHIIMDLRKKRVIIVEYQNQMIKFLECRDGLYYYDNVNKFISQMNYYYYLSTLKDNTENFSNLEFQGADEARKVQQEIGWPSTSHFKDIASENLL